MQICRSNGNAIYCDIDNPSTPFLILFLSNPFNTPDPANMFAIAPGSNFARYSSNMTSFPQQHTVISTEAEKSIQDLHCEYRGYL